ncbi:hypothetical protein ACFLXT_03345 [Chloroflexota bacterium]
MLTNDEKEAILELRARGYSFRKITDTTHHSENTVQGVIKAAEEQIVGLISEGLETAQIAEQLDIPITFINYVVRKNKSKQLDEIDNELEEAVKPEVEEVDIEESLPIEKPDINTSWIEFQSDEEIKRRRAEIRKDAIDLLALFEEAEKDYKAESVFNEHYNSRQKALKAELNDFVLKRVDEVESEEDISSLKNICEEIREKADILFNEYNEKLGESVKAGKMREIALSHKLLNSKIDIPMFPESMKEQIKKRFLVRNMEEASTVADALSQIAFLIMDNSHKKPEKEKEMWESFTLIVKEGEWDYLNRMAAQYRKDTEKIPKRYRS